MSLRDPKRALCRLLAFFLICSSTTFRAEEKPSPDFKVTLFPIGVERQNGKPVFRVKVRLTYQGKSAIRMASSENIFVPPDAGFIQRSIYFSAQPEFPMCSIRQVMVSDHFPPPIVKTIKPGEILEEEWVTDGIDINGASFSDGRVRGGGCCMNKPGKYQIKVIFAATTAKRNVHSLGSNVQPLEIP